MAYGAFLAIILLMPETSYTRGGNVDDAPKRVARDHFKIWPVSGGGAPKVASKWHSFRYPWYYLPHPIVLLSTAFFSMYLATNDYMLTTNAIAMQEVYNFGLTGISLTSLAPSLGVVVGIIYGGYANDKVFLASHVVLRLLTGGVAVRSLATKRRHSIFPGDATSHASLNGNYGAWRPGNIWNCRRI